MKNVTAEQLIAFEARIRDSFAAGELPYLIHLGGGNEAQLIKIFEDIKEGDWVLASHRNHYHALLSGMDPEVLEQKIRDGNSMFVYGKALTRPDGRPLPSDGRGKGEGGLRVNFITSAILGGLCGIAAGLALSIVNYQLSTGSVWCFLGDGAADNGHLFEAAQFVECRGLPCTFIIEDNDRSVDAAKVERRGHTRPHFDPFRDFIRVRTYHYTPTYPHGGAGLKTMVEFKADAVARAKKKAEG